MIDAAQNNFNNSGAVVMPQTVAPVLPNNSPNNSMSTMNQVNTPQTINTAPAQAPVSAPAKSHKKLIGVIVILAVLLLLGAGGAAAYYFYYNSDAKILSDAWQKVMAAESMSFVSNSSAQIKTDAEIVTFSGQSDLSTTVEGWLSYQAQEVKIDLQVDGTGMNTINAVGEIKHTQNGDVFVQVRGLESAVEEVGLSGMLEVSNLENQWIRIGKEIIDEYTTNADLEWQQLSECLQNNWQTIRRDKTMNQELLQAVIASDYFTYQRLEAQQIEDKMAIGYELTVNQQQAPALANNIKQTQAFQLMGSCLPQEVELLMAENVNEGLEEVPTVNLPKTTIWLDQKTHEPVRMTTELDYVNPTESATITSSVSGVTDVKLNASVDVQAPAEYKEMEEVVGSLFGVSVDDTADKTIGVNAQVINMQGEVLDKMQAEYELTPCTEESALANPEVSTERPSISHVKTTDADIFGFAVAVSCEAGITDYVVEPVYDESSDTLYVDLLNDKTYTDSGCTCVMTGEVAVSGLTAVTKKVLLNQEM